MVIVEARGSIKVVLKIEDLEEFQRMLLKDVSFEYIEHEISDEAYEEVFNPSSDEVERASVALQVMGVEVAVYEGADKKIIIKTSSDVKTIENSSGIKASEIVRVVLEMVE